MVINVEEIKQKILLILQNQGPKLPVQIAREIQLSPTLTSAILSELSSEKQIKISSMKIGSSPLYLLPSQNSQLENFSDNLTDMEKTAFLKLKQNKILKDEIQEPAIRVAIRSLKDFAIPIKFQDKLYWKYFTINNEEINNILNKKPTPIKQPMSEQTPSQTPKKTPPKLEKTEPQNQLIGKIKLPKKLKPNPFLEQVKSFLEKKDIELLKEISSDKKEIIAKIRINSEFGKLIFLLIAKNKKKPQQADITMAYQKAIEEKMPCYLLTREEPSKKTLEFLNNYKDIIKIEKISKTL